MINVYTKIKSSSGADFTETPTVKGEELVTKTELKALEERVKQLEPVISVGSFFMEGVQNQHEGFRIKIISDSEGNVSEVITGTYNTEGIWEDQTGIQAAIYGMAWNAETNSFEDPVAIPYNMANDDGSFATENTFDKEKIMPWAGIKHVEKEETVDGVTFVQHLAGVPKFYYTGVQVPANTITLPGSSTPVAYDGFIQVVSSVPLKSFEVFGVTVGDATVYEEFIHDDKELDYVYDAIYRPSAMKLSDQSYVVSCAPWSDNKDATDEYVLVSQPLSENTYPVAPRSADIFVKKINSGAGYDDSVYSAGTWQQYYRMKLLYRLEFNTINSQSVMNGNTSTNRNPGWTEEFICKAVQDCSHYSGTMDYYEKSCGKGLAMANGCFQNPLIYRFHSDLFSVPYQLPVNMFMARNPENSQQINFYLGKCRKCVFNWTGTQDETSCLTDYLPYYDSIEITSNGSINNYGAIKEESWDKNGIVTLPEWDTLVCSGFNEANGYGDYAYIYAGTDDLPVSGAYRFAPVWLSYGNSSYCYGSGASAFNADSGSSYYWGGSCSCCAGSALSLHFSE